MHFCMDPCGFEGVEPPNRTKLCRKNWLYTVHVDRGMVKLDSFTDRNCVYAIQGNEKYKTHPPRVGFVLMKVLFPP